MNFELSVNINRPPADVFAFLRDKDRYQQEPGSPVLILEKTTDGPAGVGTRYREVVKMFPFVRGAIISEITRFQPPRFLEEEFRGAGMKGYLAYEFVPQDEGTKLIQRESLALVGPLKVFGSTVKRVLEPRLLARLQSIKADLEGGWQADPERESE